MENTVKIKINNDFTPYTVDTYSFFSNDFECFDDSAEFDMRGVVSDLGKKVADFIVENYPAIKKASVTDVFTPKYYNYTTDAVELSCDVDLDLIDEFIEVYKVSFDEFLQGEASYYLRVSDEEKKVIFYIQKLHDDSMVDEYQQGVYEDLLEIYYNNQK